MPLSSPPLALYVHFPWCVRKCPYCDFNSYAIRGREDARGEWQVPESAYVDALLRDLEAQAPQGRGRTLGSVFLGGGTPSLFSPEAIARVLQASQRAFGLAEDVEVTLEANPGTIERGRFAEYRSAGVNRVSLGAQSFDAQILAVLGRIHSPEETCRAAEELHAAGLQNFNLDLMYALPGQDVRAAVADIECGLALAPAHLSHYQLTLEPGTVFAARPPSGLPSEDEAAEMLACCAERLAAAGFAQYETSAHARPGRAARHNCNYWTFGDYVGIGAGAHGKLTDAAHARILRTVQTREPRRYMAAPVESLVSKPVEACDLPFEFMLNALRLTGGFERELFESRTGLKWAAVAPILERLETRGLVFRDGVRWAATAFGARFLNDVLVSFLPAEPERALERERGLKASTVTRALATDPGALSTD
ncbi:MAG TPA: radical SAM family heme chaperone HemW [Steroidobacteraceae bacterium]|nr:radical SAM family heme chaperone HemW [Steroidobacteraceae bacterium]